MLNRQVRAKRGLCRGMCLALVVVATAAGVQSEKATRHAEAKFIVLRTDRITEWVSTGQTARLNCTIVGFGNMAQMNCSSSTSTNGIPLVYHVALVVGSNQVGYIISCGGGLLRRIGCEPLTAGQSLRGFAEGGKLSFAAGSKIKSYSIVTSAYVGSIGQDKGPTTPTGPSASGGVNVQTVSSRPSDHLETQTEKHDANPDTGAVAFTSEPRGADIYIDGKFVGNAPSIIQLSPGLHAVRIESPGHEAWTRTLDVTAGSKATVQAVLAPRN